MVFCMYNNCNILAQWKQELSLVNCDRNLQWTKAHTTVTILADSEQTGSMH